MYLGLDLGTSGVKALLIGADQAVIASAHAGLAVSRPHPGWSEQDPAAWVAACEATMDELAASHPAEMAAVTGIGLSGQMHGAVALDDGDRVLRPAILWNDTRAHADAAALDADPRFRRISGNIVFAGFTAPKLVWMRRHEPDLFARVAKVLLPKDYLRLWLTGEHAGDMSDASGTSWLDVAARDWSDELLEASGMRRDQMPRLVEGSAPSGVLRAELAGRWRMGRAVVAGGAGDNAATAIGAGIIAPGLGFVSLGTSGVVFAATDSFRPLAESAVHAFCHAVPDTWHQMGVILSASAALEWLAGILQARPADLTAGLGALRAPGEVCFLPYLSGERTPHNDPAARGELRGLSAASGRDDLTRAVLEGVAFALRDNLDALALAGTRLDGVLAMGGGARSDYWLRVIASALNLPVHLPEGGDFGAAFGAARLGLMAATGAGAGIAVPPPIARVIEPDPALVPAFAEAHARFCGFYNRTAP